MKTRLFLPLLVVSLTLAHGAGAAAQSPQPVARPPLQDGSGEDAVLPPVAPATITRNVSGTRAVVRANRLTAPIHIDGKLEEDIYSSVVPISDFIQSEPVEGQPATEKTEVWVF